MIALTIGYPTISASRMTVGVTRKKASRPSPVAIFLRPLLGPKAFCQLLFLRLTLLVRLLQAQIACVTWSLLGLPTSQRIGL